jgi:hypothetical protein
MTGSRGENVSNLTSSESSPDHPSSEYVPEPGLYARLLSREEKIKIMEQAVAVETGKVTSSEVFNSFYAEDLILFGIKNDIGEAVRLGERMLAELDQVIPINTARVIKQYKLTHSEKYSSAMKLTGPIQMPRVPRSKEEDSFSRDTIVNMDDPYWQEYLLKNRRFQDSHRLPSALAWDHRQDMVLSEVVDGKRKE